MRVGAVVVVVRQRWSLASAGWAGEVYRWTDAQGVLHIADVPPPKGHDVQTQTLARAARAPRLRGGRHSRCRHTGRHGRSDARRRPPAAGAEPARGAGAGRHHREERGARWADRGTASAARWRTRAAHRARRRDRCARDVAGAGRRVSGRGDRSQSSTLKPGEKAEFSADFDNPCFRGPTQVDLRAQWE